MAQQATIDDETTFPNSLPPSAFQPISSDHLMVPNSHHRSPPSPPRPNKRRDSQRSCNSRISLSSDSSNVPLNSTTALPGQASVPRRCSSPSTSLKPMPSRNQAANPPTSRFVELLRCLAEEHERVVSHTRAALLAENMALSTRLCQEQDPSMRQSSGRFRLHPVSPKRTGQRRDRAATTSSANSQISVAAKAAATAVADAALAATVNENTNEKVQTSKLPSTDDALQDIVPDTSQGEPEHDKAASSPSRSQTRSLSLLKWRQAVDNIRKQAKSSSDCSSCTANIVSLIDSFDTQAASSGEPSQLSPTDHQSAQLSTLTLSAQDSTAISTSVEQAAATSATPAAAAVTAVAAVGATVVPVGDAAGATCESSYESSSTLGVSPAQMESEPQVEATQSQGGGSTENLPTLLKSESSRSESLKKSPKRSSSDQPNRFSVAMRHLTAFKRQQLSAHTRTSSTSASSMSEDSIPAAAKEACAKREEKRAATIGHIDVGRLRSPCPSVSHADKRDENSCARMQITVLSHWQELALRSPGTSFSWTFSTHRPLSRASRSWVLSQHEQQELQRAFGRPRSLMEKLSTMIIVRPGSKVRITWDFVGMTLILYDLVAIPMQIFELPRHIIFDMMARLTLSFWTVDIPFSFITGFYREGVLEERLDQIARHYARTWLIFDIVVISVDWCLTIAGEVSDSMAADSVGYMRFGKTLRFLRMLRLLRLLKVHGLLSDLIERVSSEFCLIMLGIARIIVSIMLINHLIACSWYGVGTINDSWEDTWVHHNDLQSKHFRYQYTTALHWSLTQFTPASMEVVPKNSLERLFAVCVLLFAMVTFSSLVSSITNAMTQLRNLNSEHLEQTAMLRRYLGENKISAALMGRIWGCMQQVMDKSKRKIHEKDVAILAILPCTLKGDLQEEVYFPILATHPFFHQLASEGALVSRRIYQQAVEEVSMGVGQELFNAGDEASKMFFILSGNCQYSHESTAVQSRDLTQGHFVSEAALWLCWEHAGQLAASTHCELLAILSETLATVASDHAAPPRYARLFAKHFQGHSEKLTDVFLDLAVLQTISQKAFAPDTEDDSSISDQGQPLLQHEKHVSTERSNFTDMLMGLVPPMPSPDRRQSINSFFQRRLSRGQSSPSLEPVSPAGSEHRRSDNELGEDGKSDSASSRSSSVSTQGSRVLRHKSPMHSGRCVKALPSNPSVIAEETASHDSSKQECLSDNCSKGSNDSLGSAATPAQECLGNGVCKTSTTQNAWN